MCLNKLKCGIHIYLKVFVYKETLSKLKKVTMINQQNTLQKRVIN